MSDALLDTHALLWWLIDSPKLSSNARRQIAAPETRIWVSAASAWEIATKHRLGKLPEAEPLISDMPLRLRQAGLRELPVSVEHAVAAGRLQSEHRDPFDRMLIAQVLALDYPVVTKDPAFAGFGVRTIW